MSNILSQFRVNRTYPQHILILLAIFALAVFLRTFNLLETASVMEDTGRDLLVAKHLAQYSAPLSVSPTIGSSHPHHPLLQNSPFYFLFLGLLWKLAPSVEGVVILFAYIQSLVVFTAYFLGKYLYNKTTGYWLGLYVAISPFFVQLGRWIWQPNLLALFIPLLLAFFVKILSEKKDRHSPLSLSGLFLTANVCLHLHWSTLPVIALIFSWIAFLSFKRNYKQWLVGALIILSLVFRFTVSYHPEQAREVPSHTTLITTRFKDIWNNTEAWRTETFESAFYSQKQYVFIMGAGFLLAGGLLHKNKKKDFLPFQKKILPLLVLVFSSVLGLFYNGFLHLHYFAPQEIIFRLLFGAALFYCMKQIGIWRWVGMALTLWLTIFYFYTSRGMSYWYLQDIRTLHHAAKEIQLDLLQNEHTFSILFINTTGEPVYYNNTALWNFLEQKLEKQLVTVIQNESIIQEPGNVEVLYVVSIDNKLQGERKASINKVFLKEEGLP